MSQRGSGEFCGIYLFKHFFHLLKSLLPISIDFYENIPWIKVHKRFCLENHHRMLICQHIADFEIFRYPGYRMSFSGQREIRGIIIKTELTDGLRVKIVLGIGGRLLSFFNFKPRISMKTESTTNCWNDIVRPSCWNVMLLPHGMRFSARKTHFVNTRQFL